MVNEGGGTGDHLRLQNIELCGKSGTAQLMSYDTANRLGKKRKDNGWFVGYAPRRNPEIVVALLCRTPWDMGPRPAPSCATS